MKDTIADQLAARQCEIQLRLDSTRLGDCSRPVMTASNTSITKSPNASMALPMAALGVFTCWPGRIGLIDAISTRTSIILQDPPALAPESDHVLNIAYNSLCNGSCLQDIELRRNDVNFLDALGARRIPDPTTAGDFCRRFRHSDIESTSVGISTMEFGWVCGNSNRSPSSKKRFWTPTAPWWPPTPNTNKALISPMMVPGATTPCWSAWPTPARSCASSIVRAIALRTKVRADALGPSRRDLLPGWLPQSTGCVAIRDFSQTEHLDRWNGDRRIRFIFGYDTRPVRSTPAEAVAGKGLEAARASPTAPASHPTASADAQRQGGTGAGTGLRDAASAL